MLIGRMHVPNEHGGGTWVRIGRMHASKKHGEDAWVLVGRMGVSDKHRTGGKTDDCCHTVLYRICRTRHTVVVYRVVKSAVFFTLNVDDHDIFMTYS